MLISFFVISFFVTVVVIPFGVTFTWVPPETSLGDLVLLFVFFSAVVGYLFRTRVRGRACLAKVYSFDRCNLFAFGAGASALSGSLVSDNIVASVMLILLAIVLTIYALVRGPVYGWAHYKNQKNLVRRRITY